jgi:arabinofuranan 3-O-arabinosyltransferase
VVAGTGLDPGWSATADGVDLGPPVLVDGYSAGWLVADGAAHTVEIGYRPAGRSTLAGALSLAGSVGCLALVARSAVRRRRAGRAVQEQEVSGVSSQADDLRVVTGSGRVAAWAAVVLAAWVAGGAVLAGAAVALTAWHLVRPPAPAVLLGLATALLAVVPVAWVVGNAERLGPATADLVLANPFPGQLAAVAVLLLAVGVARDVLVRRGSPA